MDSAGDGQIGRTAINIGMLSGTPREHFTHHAHLTAHVVMRSHAEIPGSHTGGQVNASQQPADDDAEQPRNAEEDQGAPGSPGHANHQNRTE